jgi:hypothetical protein
MCFTDDAFNILVVLRNAVITLIGNIAEDHCAAHQAGL